MKKFKLVFLLAAFTLAGCSKEIDLASPNLLLTRFEWKLLAHGQDINGNNTLEAGENMIEDCQKDNRYIFLSGGKGRYLDNTLSCGNVSESEYSWQFVNNSHSIVIASEHFSILSLNAYELVLKHEVSGITTILHYTH